MDGPAASASSSESPTFCLGPCSAEGRAVSGPGQRPSASLHLWLPTGCCLGWWEPKAPLRAHPSFPVQSGEESTLLHSRNCKIKFPRCSGPRSSACCLERKWGLGKAAPYFLPAHPAFPVPPSTAGAVNHSQPASPAAWPSPSPQVSCQPPSFGSHSCTDWAAPEAGRQVPHKP